MKHLLPTDQVERHRIHVECPCRPEVTYVEVGAGMRPAVAVHRRLADEAPAPEPADPQ